MKKTTILLGMLSVSFAYAQQTGDPTGKVGVNTNAPTETLEVKGTVKVQELPTEGADKIYNGQAGKNGTFTPKKTVVANEHGVLGVVEHIVESGDAAKTALKWNDKDKKWEAVTPGATSGNIYTVDGNIPANTTRTVTLDKGTGSGSGKLKFILPDGEQQSFNIVQGGNGDGFGLTRSGANNKNQVNFFDHDNTRLASVGFNGSDNIFRINNEKDENILLEDKVQIANIPADNTSTSILVEGANGLVSKRNVTDLLPATQNDEAWKKAGTTNRITNAEDTSNIYRNTNVGIGDLSAADFQSSLHIRKANTASTVKKFATFQISDKQVTANDLQSTLEFTDSAGTKYAHIGDNSATEKTFDVATEKGYNLNLSTARNSDSDKTYIGLYADGTGTNNAVRMRFYTGKWGGNPNTDIAVTSVGANGNWWFGADGDRTRLGAADQKVVIQGALRLSSAGALGTSMSHNSTRVENNSTPGTMGYTNGHFFGFVAEGSTNKWKQLDNVDYTGANGITVNGSTISLPTGTAGQILTWQNNAWVAQTPTAGLTDNLYTANGTISAGANRMVTLANPATGGTAGATLSFTLPNATDKAFNIIQASGTRGFSLSTKEASQTQNLINFFNNATARQGYLGFTTDSHFHIGNEKQDGNIVLENKTEIKGDEGVLALKAVSNNASNFIAFHRKQGGQDTRNAYLGYASSGDANKDFTIRNEITTGKIVLDNEVKIGTLDWHPTATEVLVNDGGVVKKKAIERLFTGERGITVSGSTIGLPTGSNGQVLTYNGSTWVASAPSSAPSSPWYVAGSVTTPGQGGTIATNLNNPRKYAGDAFATDNAKIFYSGKFGVNVGLTAAEKEHWMPGAINISGSSDQISIQNSSKAWNLSSPGDTFFLTFNTMRLANGTAATTPVARIATTSDGNVGFGSNMTVGNGNNSINVTDGVLYEAGSKKLSIKGTAAGQISLDAVRRVKIGEIPEHNGATHVLVENGGIVSKKAISSISANLPRGNAAGQVLTWSTSNGGSWVAGAAPAAGGSSPFRVAGGTTPASSSDNNRNIYHNGVVGIGDFASNANIALIAQNVTNKKDVKLVVNGAVAAGSFKGTHGAHIFPDYVFQKYYTGTSSIKADYAFQSLSQVEDFVKANGHLPGYKSAADIKAQGYIDVMETQISNVEKIEELYLHTIEQEKALKEKDAKIKALEERLERLEKLIK